MKPIEATALTDVVLSKPAIVAVVDLTLTADGTRGTLAGNAGRKAVKQLGGVP
jgi:hypothetical protein